MSHSLYYYNKSYCTCYTKNSTKISLDQIIHGTSTNSDVLQQYFEKMLSTLICQHYQSTSRDPAIYYLSCKNDLSFTTQHTCYRTFLNGCMQIDVLYEKGGKPNYEIEFKVFTP